MQLKILSVNFYDHKKKSDYEYNNSLVTWIRNSKPLSFSQDINPGITSGLILRYAGIGRKAAGRGDDGANNPCYCDG